MLGKWIHTTIFLKLVKMSQHCILLGCRVKGLGLRIPYTLNPKPLSTLPKIGDNIKATHWARSKSQDSKGFLMNSNLGFRAAGLRDLTLNPKLALNIA